MKVSICIPTYNGQKFFESCLDSAIGQTYRDIEIIIVDDCSTDNTYEIAKKYASKDSRIRLFQNEKNAGLVPNWNHCIELSKGKWIKFLFQDDALAPNCIEVMINSLSPNDRIVTSARRLILDEALDESTRTYSISETLTFERFGIISKVPVFIPAEKISSLAVQNVWMNFIGEPTVIMFQKEVTRELGVFNPDLIQVCDLEYFLRIACNYGVKYIPQPLTYFRVHKGSASSSNISERYYQVMHLDPIIMLHQFLYATFFAPFRKALPISLKIKLKLVFMLRVRESYEKSLHSTPENQQKFATTGKKYPGIAVTSRQSFFGLIFLSVVKIMVRLRRIFKK